MSAIDDAIAAIQQHALALTSVSVKSAPEYPIENTDPLPMVVSYISGGEFSADNATIHHNFPIVTVEFHFSRVNLKQAYQQINNVAIEFPRRLVGDPTLGGTIDTIVFGRDVQPIQYTARPFSWGNVVTQMLRFDVRIKTRQVPIT